MYVTCRYSIFHRQCFPSRPDSTSLNAWLAGRWTHLLSLLKDKPLRTSATTAQQTESSGTSGRQLKLTDYQLLALSKPDNIHRVTLWLYLWSSQQQRPATTLTFWTLILYRQTINFNYCSLITWQRINDYFMTDAAANLLLLVLLPEHQCTTGDDARIATTLVLQEMGQSFCIIENFEVEAIPREDNSSTEMWCCVVRRLNDPFEVDLQLHVYGLVIPGHPHPVMIQTHDSTGRGYGNRVCNTCSRLQCVIEA